jgi:HAD superfamily hydrolase (TIGR01549 family)
VTITTAVFDLDGTLVDSDRALIAPFLRLGVPRSAIVLGRLLEDECDRLGVTVEDYLDHYDSADVEPFPGVPELLARLPRWAVASHKVRVSGEAELDRLGWAPDVALFAEDFGGGHKSLAPVLERLGVDAAEVVFVGDTDHDRACAREVGATFALAGWNPRAVPEPGDVVLARPADLVDLGIRLLAG